MLCYIYRSSRRDGAYLYIKKDRDFSPVPEELMNYFGQPIFVMSLLLHPPRKLALLHSDELKAILEEKSYYFNITTDHDTNKTQKK